jgi:hypothetical protein
MVAGLADRLAVELGDLVEPITTASRSRSAIGVGLGERPGAGRGRAAPRPQRGLVDARGRAP